MGHCRDPKRDHEKNKTPLTHHFELIPALSAFPRFFFFILSAWACAGRRIEIAPPCVQRFVLDLN
jgi:hypothetical protein